MKRWIRRILIGVLGLVALWCVLGLTLSLWPVSGFPPAPHANSGPQPQTQSQPLEAEPSSSPSVVDFTTQDGTVLRARLFPGHRALTVLLLPGVLTEARDYDAFATKLVEESGADVLALDLRGHGESDGPRGDVAFIGQYGHDVASIVSELKRRDPDHRLILAGYSMGGGIALRYAEEGLSPGVDGYLLLAPLMGPDSPTSRTEAPPAEAGGTAEPAGMILHVPRLIGLVMLNTLHVRLLNSLTTLEFTPSAGNVTRSYSFRAMVGMTPTHHVKALTANDAPLLALVGARDQVFHVDEFPAVIGLHENGESEIIEGVDHDHLLLDPETTTRAGVWLRSHWP